ncbi:uncharacterized protein V3H82_018658 [Fundulus diaphanus]
MQLASLSLFLIAVHASVRVDCRPRLQHLQRQRTGSSEPAARPDSSAGSGLRRVLHREPLVATGPDNLVVIFDWGRKRFLCVDIKGQLYKSRQKHRRPCLFWHLWFQLAKHSDLFFSVSGSWLIKPGGGGQGEVHRGPTEGPSALLERFLRRQRRSEEVNPSDPLRTESHPAPPAKDAEQNQAGAVSKETITSCDDPLRVLRPNGHGSPVKTNIADRAEHE